MDGNGFWRDGGSLALDFVGTTGLRRGELLGAPADLTAWLGAVGLGAVQARSADLERARALRSAMTAAVEAVMAGRRPAAQDLAAINAAAAAGSPAPRLVWVRGALVAEPGAGSVDAALATVARDLVELLGGPLRDRLRACAADDCSGIFLDVSRGERRRWCSSTSCGNRARVAAHRRRAQP